jgi:hypothetical protein
MYTVLGFIGYGVATLVATALALAWELSLGDRLIALVTPPLAFVIVVAVATAIVGSEWIVFYQTAITATVMVAALGALTGGNIERLLDVAVLGMGVFLVFGRIGCFAVACCHGRPARRGVVYSAEHVAAGFWSRWSERPLVPIQLVESGVSFVLVAVGLVLAGEPGRAALVYGVGYAVARFVLELWRGDVLRPYAYGLSEAQWWSLALAAACAIVAPSIGTLTALGAVACGAAYLVARRRHRELLLPPHLRALDLACADALRADVRRDTMLGVGVSCKRMDDGQLDWVLSSSHPAWSPAAARRIAADLWRDCEVIDGRTPGLVHVLVGPDHMQRIDAKK